VLGPAMVHQDECATGLNVWWVRHHGDGQPVLQLHVHDGQRGHPKRCGSHQRFRHVQSFWLHVSHRSNSSRDGVYHQRTEFPAAIGDEQTETQCRLLNS